MITHTIDVTEFFPPEKELKVQKLEVIFIPEWEKENIRPVCNGIAQYEDFKETVSNSIANMLMSMGGPAITFGTKDPAKMLFDYNKMTTGDISHQVNIFFYHIAEMPGDVKELVNAIQSLRMRIIENLITESK